jgi:mannose-6-phosphate isomerase-like protein (cupin superfamily)
MTIAQLAKETGFSTGYISSVERGRVNPSLSALYKITSALNIDPGLLFEADTPSNQQIQIVRKHERLTVVYPSSNIHYELLTRDLSTRKVEFLRVTIPTGKSSGPKMLVHEGEEYGLILKGRMELTVGDEKFILLAGDSVSFQSTVPHSVANAGKTEIEAIWAMTPPRL